MRRGGGGGGGGRCEGAWVSFARILSGTLFF